MFAIPRRQDRFALIWAALGLLWSIALLVLALKLTDNEGQTFIQENGNGVLYVVMAPAVISFVVLVALWVKGWSGSRVSGGIATMGVGLLGGMALLGVLTIGLYIMPAAMFLAVAIALSNSGPPAERSAGPIAQ